MAGVPEMNEQWFFGIEGKYQWTEDLEFDDAAVLGGRDLDTNTSADNWRIGAKTGFVF